MPCCFWLICKPHVLHRFVNSHAGHLMGNIKAHNPVLPLPFVLFLGAAETFFCKTYLASAMGSERRRRWRL